MTEPNNYSRRALLMKLGILFNGIVAAFLAIPIVRYLLSPVARFRREKYEAWLPLGVLDQYPTGETRFASFRNPDVQPTDGKTADSACWVRRVDDKTFQVFAINCAHLGCPVRWFPQSRLFLCPCHGGAYYEDGSRASGPPERGLFEYDYKLEDGKLFVKAGQLPTLATPMALVNIGGKLPCG
ncbi:MAG: Rieske (2Fe-2S) protein [Candidatus Acidiferrum sp.]|jgi:menaquinol-cytochrome c reductase iron-sulfur subunit